MEGNAAGITTRHMSSMLEVTPRVWATSITGCWCRARTLNGHCSITPTAARLAGELKRNYTRRGVTLNLGDVILAAVAIHKEITLLTDNLKDFPMADLSLHSLPKT